MAGLQVDMPEIPSDRGTFRAEYERELGHWLRRRLGWLCVTYAAFQVFGTLSMMGSMGALARAGEREAAADASSPRPAPHGAPGTRALTPLDAVVEVARGVQKQESGGTATPQPIGRIVDRWWDDAIRPITARERSSARGTVGADAASTAPSDGDAKVVDAGSRSEPVDPGRASPEDARARGAPDAANDANDARAPGPDDRSDEPPAASVPRSARADSTDDPLSRLPWWIWALLGMPPLAVLAWFGLRVRPKLYTRGELVAGATRLILALGFMTFALETAIILASPSASVVPLFSIFFWHLTASLFLPWTWRESLRPIAPLFIAWVLLRAGIAASDGAWIGFVVSVLFAPLVFLPAVLLCYVRLRWHRNRFKSGFVGRRFLAMRREFLQARAVHESLFPPPLDSACVRFDFAYRPAADIGGDFIHAWTDEDERLWVVLLDVTGHGLASAMSVARIHGEIERLRDEHPDDGPGRLLARLNRYFRRLLSRHGHFATAIILRIDPRRGQLRYASAGHPPMFLRSRGELRELASTTFLLGAVDDAAFGEDEETAALEERDALVLFTDGAHEARNPAGAHFGLERLREILRQPAAPAAWPPYLMRLIETFEAGRPEDDLLIAEIVLKRRISMSSGITGDAPPEPLASLAGAHA